MMLVAAATLLTAPAFAQSAANQDDPLAGLVEQNKIDSSVPGTPEILYNQQIGVGVGAAKEAALAYRGPYNFGECPDGTILTTYGTCAQLKR